MNIQKLLTILVPLLIAGGGVYLSVHKSSSPGTETAPSAAVEPSVPQNSAHEKASLEEQLSSNPGHTPILLRLAEISAAEGNAAGAIQYLKQALQADAKNADARLELGRALYDTGDVDGAIQETTQLLKDHPTNVDGLYNLGAIYANQDKIDLARQYWLQAVAADPASESGVKAKDGLGKLGP